MLSVPVALMGILIAYLVGSICSAVIVSKLCHLKDPRLEGSKNPGATNVLRLSGKKYAVIVLLVDMLKGTLPVLLAHFFGVSPIILGFICLASVLGHIYPVFFNFQGGKGVATALGALLGFNPLVGVCVLFSWLLTAFISHFSSLASIIAISLAPVYTLFFSGKAGACLPLIILTGIILYQHRENFARLRNQTEPKINLKKRTQ
jgi:glycerol-3-phosphate acyltransferase PlsY